MDIVGRILHTCNQVFVMHFIIFTPIPKSQLPSNSSAAWPQEWEQPRFCTLSPNDARLFCHYSAKTCNSKLCPNFIIYKLNIYNQKDVYLQYHINYLSLLYDLYRLRLYHYKAIRCHSYLGIVLYSMDNHKFHTQFYFQFFYTLFILKLYKVVQVHWTLCR